MKRFLIMLTVIVVIGGGGFFVYDQVKAKELDNKKQEEQLTKEKLNEKKIDSKVEEAIQEEPVKEEEKYDPMIMLVNHSYFLDASFKPLNLVIPYIFFSPSITEEEKYMEYEAAKAIEELVTGAENDGIILYGLSGYRSYETQQLVYDANVASNGPEYAAAYVALPGRSEHQIGLAMDFATPNGFVEEGTPEGIWLENSSYKYGFILRYPKGKEDITGFNYEPWHVRYVGKEAAKEIYEKGITFKEYFGY